VDPDTQPPPQQAQEQEQEEPIPETPKSNPDTQPSNESKPPQQAQEPSQEEPPQETSEPSAQFSEKSEHLQTIAQQEEEQQAPQQEVLLQDTSELAPALLHVQQSSIDLQDGQAGVKSHDAVGIASGVLPDVRNGKESSDGKNQMAVVAVRADENGEETAAHENGGAETDLIALYQEPEQVEAHNASAQTIAQQLEEFSSAPPTVRKTKADYIRSRNKRKAQKRGVLKEADTRVISFQLNDILLEQEELMDLIEIDKELQRNVIFREEKEMTLCIEEKSGLAEQISKLEEGEASGNEKRNQLASQLKRIEDRIEEIQTIRKGRAKLKEERTATLARFATRKSELEDALKKVENQLPTPDEQI